MRSARQVDLDGVTVVENRAFGEGCSSSIAAALSAVDASLRGARAAARRPARRAGRDGGRAARPARGGAPLAACRYDDGRGHPLLFARSMFAELAELHGDKAVWKLLERYAAQVVDVPVAGPVPLDVDTWADYRAVLATAPSLVTGR